MIITSPAAIPTSIAGNGTYTPVGLVPANEEAAERGFAGAENELRYHFNLPNTLQPSDSGRGHLRRAQSGHQRLGSTLWRRGVCQRCAGRSRRSSFGPPNWIKPITTPSFTLASVNARVGLGPDNIVTLRGISYSTAGGGNSLGIDYVRLKADAPAARAALVGRPQR